MNTLQALLLIHHLFLAAFFLIWTQIICRLKTNNHWLNLTYFLILLMWFYLNPMIMMTTFLAGGILIILAVYVSQAESVQLSYSVQLIRLSLLVASILAIEQLTHLFLANIIPNSLTGVPGNFFLLVIALDGLKLIIAWFVLQLPKLKQLRPMASRLPVVWQLVLSVVLLIGVSLWYQPLRYSVILVRGFPVDSPLFYLSLLAFVIVIILIQYIILWRKKNLEESIRAEQLAQYNANIETLYNQLALFRHDYLNILYSMRLSIEQEDMESVRQIFEETVSPTRKMVQADKFEIGKLSALSAPELKSILYTKLVEAQARGIQLEVEIVPTDQQIPISSTLLVRLVAILLDNAMNAAEEADKKVLTFTFKYAHAQFNMMISNTYQNLGQLLTEPQAPAKRLLTFNQAQHLNGNGLYYVKQAVQENPQLQFLTEVTETEVKQYLTILDK